MQKKKTFRTKQHKQKALVNVSAFLSVCLFVVYAISPIRVQAMPIIERIPGVGPLVISIPDIQNTLPVDRAGTREMTTQEIFLSVCEARGYGLSCAKALLGMMWKESLFDGKAIGDYGAARGYFQIHYQLHNIPIACAEDLRCSAEWTLDYLEYNGYPRYVTYAIQCHNGCNAGNDYARSALRHGERMWHYDFSTHFQNKFAMR